AARRPIQTSKELGKRDVQGARNRGQGVEVRHSLRALDHGEKRNADVRSFGEVSLRERKPMPQLTNPLTQFLSYSGRGGGHSRLRSAGKMPSSTARTVAP